MHNNVFYDIYFFVSGKLSDLQMEGILYAVCVMQRNTKIFLKFFNSF